MMEATTVVSAFALVVAVGVAVYLGIRESHRTPRAEMERRVEKLEAALDEARRERENDREAWRTDRLSLLETLETTTRRCNDERAQMLDDIVKERLAWQQERQSWQLEREELYEAGEELSAKLDTVKRQLAAEKGLRNKLQQQVNSLIKSGDSGE